MEQHVVHPVALFRLSVLGPLASRERLSRGELKMLIRQIADQTYSIPDSRRTHISEDTLTRWYYAWREGGIDALAPRARKDKGQTKLAPEVQASLIEAKQHHPHRSLNTLILLLEKKGVVSKGQLARATVHRFLRQHKLSKRTQADGQRIERRRFEANYANDLWYGDVMHGPRVLIQGRQRKLYLVSLMDDASRLIVHSAFCLGETALDIEYVLKQALLKRGLPKKLVIDNGPAYRAGSLQEICARLQVRLIYCRPYEPEGKGKLERWHSTVRQQFLSELQLQSCTDLNEVNTRLWAWLEEIYHRRAHGGLKDKMTPLKRWQHDLAQMTQLGVFAHQIDEIFYHRHKRKVRKDGTISFEGRFFEVPYELAGKTVQLVVDSHKKEVLWVESRDGKRLGAATPLDVQANNWRKRQRPTTTVPQSTSTALDDNLVEEALKEYETHWCLDNQSTEQLKKNNHDNPTTK